MLGIGGTFFGIAVGLYYFDPSDVQSGIPNLLNGLRIAVWASFTGILFAILLKLRYALGRDDTLATENMSDAELISAQLQALQRSLAGDDEATVLSQMKLTRSDMNDGLDALRRSQAEFMERLAEMSSKTLVEALRDVIRDFNANLTEQFGDNFKELNAAVSRLVTWQEQYREQMDKLIALEQESTALMQTAVAQHKEALESSSSLLVVAEGFRSILEAAETYKDSLHSNTERLASLADKMHEEVPALRDDIVSLVGTVSQSIVNSEREVTRIGAEISAKFKEASSAIQNDLAASLGVANREINENVSRLVGSTKEQTEALQLQLEESLSESLRSLAQQMASLSSKFAEDYGPITDRLRDIVQSSRVS
jgi:plasmid maintenance system antidote protein VapI